MNKGENIASVALKLELQNTISQYAGRANQIKGFWIMERLLTIDPILKEDLIKNYGESKYLELLAYYGKTNIQQRAENELKQKEKEFKEKQKFELEKMRTENYAKQCSVYENKVVAEEVNEQEAKQRNIDTWKKQYIEGKGSRQGETALHVLERYVAEGRMPKEELDKLIQENP